MKKPAKILIAVVIIAGIVGAGLISTNRDSGINYEELIALQPKTEVKKGDLLIKVNNSGNVELKNEDSDDINNLKVVINVDELDINKIKKNQEVEIKSEVFPNEVFKGRVVNVSDKGEVENGKAKYKVEISLEKTIKEVGNINKDEVNLRQGTSKEFESIKILNKGTKVNILDTVIKSKNEKWYQVSLEDGIIGWVISSSVNITGINNGGVKATIKNDIVNIKKNTSLKSGVLAKLVKDDTVKIIGKENNYYKVKLLDGREGYIKENEVITEKLKPGMSVTTSIIVNEKKDSLYIPMDCVVKTDDGYVVVMAETAKVKKIKTGINSEDYIEVVDGLSKGDKVSLIESSDQDLSISDVKSLMSKNEN